VPVLIGDRASLRGDPLRLLSDKLMPSILATAAPTCWSTAWGAAAGRGDPARETGVPFRSLTTSARPPCSAAGEAAREQALEDFELHSHEVCSGTARSTRRTSRTSRSSPTGQGATTPAGRATGSGRQPPTDDERGQIDSSFDLPYTRLPTRSIASGPIRLREIKHRSTCTGCFGAAASARSRRTGQVRRQSQQGLDPSRVESVKQMPDFRGTISDLGGPSRTCTR